MVLFRWDIASEDEKKAKILQNFYSNLQITKSCWIIQKSNVGFGYARIEVDTRKSILAHRLSWELHNGPIPNSMVVRHLCHNPQCVRPSHLEIGTQKENYEDSKSINRHSHGKKHGMSKIDEDTAKKIKELIVLGCYTYPQIAEITCSSVNIIKDIARGRTWDHVYVKGFKTSKGRTLRGELNGFSKINDEIVREILIQKDLGKRIFEISNNLNLSQDVVGSVVRRKSWKHVPCPSSNSKKLESNS